MTASERDLVDRARAGDEPALVELLRRTTPDLRRTLAGAIPERHRGVLAEEDVLQQTYADAFLDVRAFTPAGDGAFLAWLRRMAKNSLVDAIRLLDAEKRGGTRRRLTGGTEGESFEALYDRLVQGTYTTPSRAAARGEALAALAAAVERLPDTYRTVVRLLDLEDRPVAEVAALLERSPGAVYLLRHRAHQRLGELLGGGSRFFSDSP